MSFVSYNVMTSQNSTHCVVAYILRCPVRRRTLVTNGETLAVRRAGHVEVVVGAATKQRTVGSGGRHIVTEQVTEQLHSLGRLAHLAAPRVT